MTQDNHDRGVFEGDVLARLIVIERNQNEMWAELRQMRDERYTARGVIAVGKGIWAVVGAAFGLAAAWLSSKGVKP